MSVDTVVLGRGGRPVFRPGPRAAMKTVWPDTRIMLGGTHRTNVGCTRLALVEGPWGDGSWSIGDAVLVPGGMPSGHEGVA